MTVKPARGQAPNVIDSGPKASTALYFDTRLTAAPRDEDERPDGSAALQKGYHLPWVGILEQGARAMITAAKDDIVRTLGIDLARTSSTSD